MISKSKGKRIKIDRDDSRLVFVISPRGFGHGNRYTPLVVVWEFFMAIMGYLFWPVFSQPPKIGWLLWVLVAVFILLVILPLLGIINAGSARTTLSVAGGELRITEKKSLGSKNWAWRCSEIAEIKLGYRSKEDEALLIEELQIVPKHGEKIGFHIWASENEVASMVAELQLLVRGKED